MELFDQAGGTEGQPLAFKMRPRTIDEFVGQDHIVGPGRLLRRMIQADQLSSLIFYGPPGTGKTTLARVIANTTASAFVTMNAVLSGVKDLRKAIDEAKERKSLQGKRTILFVDEVHRWNKAQQDALLPCVENGTVVLVGATTQNPYFEVISALVSRSRVFQLKPLVSKDLEAIARSALSDAERGYGSYNISIEDQALDHLVKVAAGDARSLLNALQLAVETTPALFPPGADEQIHVTLEIAEESIQRKAVLYDKEGDYHYDTISAFIKSLRGSDPDAALYWMAKMVHSGEDPHYLFRRMLILASEDVGLADPAALHVVTAAADAFDRVGMPEGQFHLAEAALYLATAPKSNSALAFFDALEAVKKEAAGEVPVHLKDANRDKNGFGHGEGYLYPHAYTEHWVAQQYLPENLKGRIFYEPSTTGYEGKVRETILRRRETQLASWITDPIQEVLTNSPVNKERERWLSRISSKKSEVLGHIRDQIFSQIDVMRHHRVLVLKADNGLLLWEAFRKAPEGGVWGILEKTGSLETLAHFAGAVPEAERPIFIEGVLLPVLNELTNGEARFEHVVGMDAFFRKTERNRLFEKIYGILVPGGRIAIAETVPRHAQRLSDYLSGETAEAGLIEKFKDAENAVYSGLTDLEDEDLRSDAAGITDWDEHDLENDAAAVGFEKVRVQIRSFEETRVVSRQDLNRWFDITDRSLYARVMSRHLRSDEIDEIKKILSLLIADKPLTWKKPVAIFTAAKQ